MLAKGNFLGGGSFGSVYEGISNDGFVFAVKEVSLLDQRDRGKQCLSTGAGNRTFESF